VCACVCAHVCVCACKYVRCVEYVRLLCLFVLIRCNVVLVCVYVRALCVCACVCMYVRCVFVLVRISTCVVKHVCLLCLSVEWRGCDGAEAAAGPTDPGSCSTCGGAEGHV